MSIQLGILIIYFVFIILLGLLAMKKVKDSEDLLVTGRNLGMMAEYMGGLGLSELRKWLLPAGWA